MVSSHKARDIVSQVRKEIEKSKGTRVWDDYVNALKLISQVIFFRSSGFVLELIQNAEDSGLGLDNVGVFEVRINERRVKIIHNGRPFTEADVRAICGIRSSKKPEKGTLGYLGIGFKSVFKVTDCPEIYSGGFQFKFDRTHKEWKDPNNMPWHVLPIWIDQPSENIDHDRTTFIIPFRDEETQFRSLLEEIKRLKTELYLFLRWLKKIEVTDEISGRSWVLENVGEDEEGITTLKHNGQEQKFKFFRRSCQVPPSVKQDRLTQEYRANVVQREIAIAFALDGENNLAPWEAGAMYGGVYSFLPLGEEKSGARFPIQADFLVQPGREAINYEAKWKYQFLPAFEFTKPKSLESYVLFGPKLIEPLQNYLETDACVPTADGGWAKPAQVVKLLEEPKAVEDLVALGILKKDELTKILGGQPDLKVVDANTKEPSPGFKGVDRLDLLNNEAFLKWRAKSPDAADWFRSLYIWLQSHPRRDKYNKKRYPKGYWEYKIILTSDGNLLEGGNVWLPDISLADPVVKELANVFQESKPMLHPDILGNVKDEEQLKVIKGFLRGLTGVQFLDSKAVCKEALLPKILTSAPKPLLNDLLKYTVYCQQILVAEIDKGSEFWVLTKQGDVRAAKETLLPKEFKPEQDWETHQQYVPGINFVNPKYLGDMANANDDQLKAWRQFFEAGGVKKEPDNGVEIFAMKWAEEKLKLHYKSVTPVDKLKYGYDLEVAAPVGENMRIEVKGQSHDHDVELKDNEVDAADIYKDSFYLCVISSIPENPTMHLVKNPAAPGVGKKDKLTIPINTWKVAKWP